jgi:hypothetical protein
MLVLAGPILETFEGDMEDGRVHDQSVRSGGDHFHVASFSMDSVLKESEV